MAPLAPMGARAVLVRTDVARSAPRQFARHPPAPAPGSRPAPGAHAGARGAAPAPSCRHVVVSGRITAICMRVAPRSAPITTPRGSARRPPEDACWPLVKPIRTQPKVVLRPGATDRWTVSGRWMCGARLETAQAQHLGGPSCEPLAGSPNRQRMALHATVSAIARSKPRCTALALGSSTRPGQAANCAWLRPLALAA